MIKDKGKPVFEETIDDVLAKKIITHTRRNSKNPSAAESIHHKKERCCASMPKPAWKCVAACAASLLSITAIILLLRFLFKRDDE